MPAIADSGDRLCVSQPELCELIALRFATSSLVPRHRLCVAPSVPIMKPSVLALSLAAVCVAQSPNSVGNTLYFYVRRPARHVLTM